ncbi:hypothetical protein H1C71_003897 [Ictidomys tridecemlineatus]|nr:hypothetical protein H1C71_003897 [Ictidomys tridecemlineatus]
MILDIFLKDNSRTSPRAGWVSTIGCLSLISPLSVPIVGSMTCVALAAPSLCPLFFPLGKYSLNTPNVYPSACIHYGFLWSVVSRLNGYKIMPPTEACALNSVEVV